MNPKRLKISGIKRGALRARLELARIGVSALLSKSHPILVHLIPIRRCNLSCTYCNEYDDHSDPVPLALMLERVDRLSALGSSMITLSGGEPLLHPDLDAIITRIRERGMFPELLTNGYFLTGERIRRLNRAGLRRLQISVDNVTPDDISKKSLKVLDQKLVRLAEHAQFDVNINSVVGGGIRRAEDALAITERARALGFSSTLGVIHDGDGQLQAFSDAERDVYRRIKEMGVSFPLFTRFKDNLVRGQPNTWRCRAGARYLYVCEEGLVHYCSQQRGVPGVPLSEYGPEHLRRAFDECKPCAPYCTISCVHTVAAFDNWRSPQRGVADMAPRGERLVSIGKKPSVSGAPTPSG
jgi:MoaA/NifB/PqqE/SkfB family radical SAM enzyme